MPSSAPRLCPGVLALVVALALLLPGCAKQEFQNIRQPTHAVQGQVTLDGKPVANATTSAPKSRTLRTSARRPR